MLLLLLLLLLLFLRKLLSAEKIVTFREGRENVGGDGRCIIVIIITIIIRRGFC